ncbi:hypothetical protein V5O48_019276, partial [Marasmius crinis-equi]
MGSSFRMPDPTPFARPQLEAAVRAPCLEEISLDYFLPLLDIGLYPLPELLCFECFTGILKYEDLKLLVTTCPRLRALSITVDTSSFRDAPDLPLLLPHLEDLMFQYDGSKSFFFLDHITTPSLAELVLPKECPTDERFLNFLDRSGCSLQIWEANMPLAYDGSDDHVRWSGVFKRMPQLQTLRVRLAATSTWEGVNALDVLCS